jgi:SAM-dependent methyltransferase
MSFNGDVVLQLMMAYRGQLAELYAYDLTPGIARFINERFERLGLPGTCSCLVNAEPDRIAIPLPDGHIQVMSCYERLEHFEDPLPLLREMRRVLAPGGRLLLLVSNRYYPHLYRYKRMRNKNYSLGRNWNRGPERKYEPAQVERLLREAGFRITASFGLQPVHLKIFDLGIKLCRRFGWHGVADRWADRAAQGFVTDGFFRTFSSTLAYELE